MLYFLGEKIHLSGICEYNYFMIECYKNADIKLKLEILIEWSDEEDKKRYEYSLTSIRAYPKIKNKDSKLIVNYNRLKNSINALFEIKIIERSNFMDKTFDINSFKSLIDYKNVNFYHNVDFHSIHDNPKVTTISDILSLQLPEEDGECPILFLTNENIEGIPNLDLITFSPQSREAKKLNEIYLTDVFQFFPVVGIPASVMKAMTFEFSKKSKPINEKLHQWAKICYDNPNTTDGLTFFREQIVPSIEEYKKIALQSELSSELLKVSKPGHFGYLQFGEMPVEKIWELMLANDNCTEEEYQELLKLKESEPFKYTGRWPVVFFREEGLQTIRDEEAKGIQLAKRKTLDID
jgi:hypothetical protein